MNSKQLIFLASLFFLFAVVACDPAPQVPEIILEEIPGPAEIPDIPLLPNCPNNYTSTAQQVYPAEGDLVMDLTPEFEWTFPLECIPVGFHLRVGTITDPQSDDVFDGDTIGLLRTFNGVTLLPATWHRWRVYTELVPGASNSSGIFVSFVTGPTCDASALVAPTLVYPADGSTYTGKSWGNPFEVEADITYPGGTCIPEGFTFYISETEDFSTPNLNIFSPAAGFTSNPEGLLLVEDDSNDVPDCTILYWKAWGTVGDTAGPESEVFSFFTNIEGTCLVVPDFDDIEFEFPFDVPYIMAPQNVNCRASDYSESKNLGTLLLGEQVEVLAVNPEATHAKIMEPSFNVGCWIWLGAVDLMDGDDMPIEPKSILDLVPVLDPGEPPAETPTPTPTDEPTEEPDDPEPTDTPTTPECSDGIDNDGDQAIDYGDTNAIASGKADRECKSPDDNNESK